MIYRPFVTFPNGTSGFMAVNVCTDQDRQAVLGYVGTIAQRIAGVQPGEVVSPQRLRELSARVDFFRVARG